MKKVLWIIVILTDSFFSYGQRTEYLLHAGSGLFSYRGPNAVDATGVYLMYFSLINPYGRASAFSYSLAGQAQHVTKSKILFGLQAGYEQLTSQVAISFVSGDIGATPATGQATLQNQYLTLHPFFGKRFGNDRFSLDATLVLDAAIGLRSREFIRVDEPYQTLWGGGEQARRIPDVDFRPRINVTAYYRSFGLNIGYSHGLTNYVDSRYSTASVYSQFWRFGLLYRLKR